MAKEHYTLVGTDTLDNGRNVTLSWLGSRRCNKLW